MYILSPKFRKNSATLTISNFPPSVGMQQSSSSSNLFLLVKIFQRLFPGFFVLVVLPVLFIPSPNLGPVTRPDVESPGNSGSEYEFPYRLPGEVVPKPVDELHEKLGVGVEHDVLQSIPILIGFICQQHRPTRRNKVRTRSSLRRVGRCC